MVLSIQHRSRLKNGRDDSYNQLINLFPAKLQVLTSPNRLVIPAKTSIYQPNQTIDRVYFPLKGIVSLLNIGESGAVAEFATVGNEGAIGVAALLGVNSTNSLAIAQTDCVAIALSSNFLKREFDRGGKPQQVLLLYYQALLFQVAQNVFCSCHHLLEQRLARWLLAYSDRLETPKISITQETLSDLLGVRRASLSVIAGDLRQRNLIHYNRGRITIPDPQALRKIACNCDRLIADEYARLFGTL